jgi:hypothetical protein
MGNGNGNAVGVLSVDPFNYKFAPETGAGNGTFFASNRQIISLLYCFYCAVFHGALYQIGSKSNASQGSTVYCLLYLWSIANVDNVLAIPGKSADTDSTYNWLFFLI